MKGYTNNPNGRPKGVPNKITQELRLFIAELVSDNREQIVEDFKSLAPKERLLILERYMQYVLPKRTRIEEERQQERTQTVSWEVFQAMLRGEKIE